MQPEFIRPDFIENNSADEIHQRMMNNLPADIDDMPGGFPYDFTKPAALEKDEFINYHMVSPVTWPCLKILSQGKNTELQC